MAITRVALGTAVNNKNGGPATISVSGIQGGSTLVLLVAKGQNVGMTARYYYDGTNYEQFLPANSINNSGNVWAGILYISYCQPSSGSAYIEVDPAGTGEECAIAAIELRGAATRDLAFLPGATGAGTSASSGSGTTSFANVILIGCIGWEGPDGDNVGSWQNSFSAGQRRGTTGGSATSNVTIQEGYRIVSSTGSYTAQVDRTTNGRDWAAVAAAFIERTYQTHSIDAHLKKESAKSHGVDAYVELNVETRMHSADAALIKQISRTHATDSLLRTNISKTHSTDALTSALQIKAHSIDALLTAQAAKTHSTGALISTVQTQTHSTNALLKAQLSRTHSIDALINAQLSAVHGVDSFIKTNPSTTHSIDALLASQTEAQTHSTDALVRATITRSHAADALLVRTGSKISTADALIKAAIEQSHSTDAGIVKAATLAHSTDAVVRKQLTQQHSADALLLAELLKSHGADALISQAGALKQHSLDAAISATVTQQHSADALVKISAARMHSTGALLAKEALALHGTDAVILKQASGAHLTSAVVLRQAQRMHGSDAYLWLGAASIAHGVSAHIDIRPPGPRTLSVLREARMLACAHEERVFGIATEHRRCAVVQ